MSRSWPGTVGQRTRKVTSMERRGMGEWMGGVESMDQADEVFNGALEHENDRCQRFDEQRNESRRTGGIAATPLYERRPRRVLGFGVGDTDLWPSEWALKASVRFMAGVTGSARHDAGFHVAQMPASIMGCAHSRVFPSRGAEIQNACGSDPFFLGSDAPPH
eukprot:ctg_2867.g485